jgi:hypothetical protein
VLNSLVLSEVLTALFMIKMARSVLSLFCHLLSVITFVFIIY